MSGDLRTGVNCTINVDVITHTLAGFKILPCKTNNNIMNYSVTESPVAQFIGSIGPYHLHANCK